MNFDETSEKLKDICDKVWVKIEDLMVTVNDKHTLEDLRQLEKDISDNFKLFCVKSEDYKSYLQRQNTKEALEILEDHKEHFNSCIGSVRQVTDNIKVIKREIVETLSQVSRSSKSTASRKRAKAEAEKVRLDYVRKESELLKQKADIEANLNIVKQESIIAVTETEAKILEGYDDQELDLPSAHVDKQESVKQYIEQLDIDNYVPYTTNVSDSVQFNTSTTNVTAPSVSKVQMQSTTQPVYTFSTSKPVVPTYYPPPPTSTHLINMATSVPTSSTQVVNSDSSMNNVMSDITRFMLRKDLLLSRFSNFDDSPETYMSWKASFQSIIKELGITPFEEMDLLVKWLGPESSRFARSLRAANAHDPPRGLRQIWERLEERYGRPEMIEHSLKSKLNNFPTLNNKDNKKMYDLVDILTEVESAMVNPACSTLLSYFNSSSGVAPIVSKLPFSLQDKWATRASSYKQSRGISYPPFSYFVKFVKEMCEIRNDPAFNQTNTNQSTKQSSNTKVVTRKTDLKSENSVRCPLHKAGHSLNECFAFRKRPLSDRQKFLKEKRICFRCCEATDHISRNCKAPISCSVCKSNRHSSAMHVNSQVSGPSADSQTLDKTVETDGGEQNKSTVVNACTELCGDNRFGRSCGKTVLVDVFSDKSLSPVRVYAIIDDQSNRTLAAPTLFDRLGIRGTASNFTLSSCSGSHMMTGRRSDLRIDSVDGKTSFNLSDVIECDSIPNELLEIPTPDVARAHPHLRQIAEYLPCLDPNARVELLIGRDVPDVHHVLNQVLGGQGKPFAQQLPLGWVVIGEVCLGKVHPPPAIVRKTNVLVDGRSTLFPLCDLSFEVKEANDIFVRTPDDNKVGLFVEDKQFIELMNDHFVMDDTGHWSAPLPFRKAKISMPNNRPLAWKRALILDSSLRRDSVKAEHFKTFMNKVFASGAVEVAPSLPENSECWYLPLFGVYHPKKPDQIRGVFDSSAVFQGTSLNQTLMSGPDLTNSLVGILMRFRENAVAFSGDIEQMFYQFRVSNEHRDYLRFFWYADNDYSKPLIEYRMTVHVFGNTPSPAIATYGIRKAVENSDSDVHDFVCNNFYVDDGLASLPHASDAISLLRKTQNALHVNGKIRFHKIISNNIEVMKAFLSDDLGKDLKDLDLCCDLLPTQRSLGLSWNLNSDMFVFSVNENEKPVTRRGILSTINSLFDPLGFIAPLSISGKILLREIVPPGTDWDDELSPNHEMKWNTWYKALLSFGRFEIPRMIIPSSLSLCQDIQIHIFSDASEKAISAIAFLKSIDQTGSISVGFLMAKSKLAPLKGHTIPRLELCAAVLASELGDSICTHLNIDCSNCHYYSDSKVVLGYVCNTTRRFFTYVSNRVEKIHKVSDPSQWSFIPTSLNPADLGTRFVSNPDIEVVNQWTKPPAFLFREQSSENLDFPLVSPEIDKEIRQELTTCKTQISKPTLETNRFERFSNWLALVRAISLLKHKARLVKGLDCHHVQIKKDSETYLVKQVQNEVFANEIQNLTNGIKIAKSSRILKLDPFLDTSGVLRVGGRLKHSTSPYTEKHPILIPGTHHIAKLLVLHFHKLTHHQGRHITEGAIRTAGFWITGLKRLIQSVLSKCVHCQRFRGKFMSQKMSDLPEFRIQPCPPFTYVGLDCFGPYEIITRRTRGGSANSKRWIVIFVCMSSRAVHFEVLEDMSTNSFINALRRFIAFRGPVKKLYSDRGTNFIGATKELGIKAIFSEDTKIQTFLNDNDMCWNFNTPYSSNMGGAWERLIGVARRIIDNILFEFRHNKLTHEVLVTFVSETMAIMNARPLVPLTTDHESPFVLSPNSLLTQKTGTSNDDFKHLNVRDIYVNQWKMIQVMANKFWTKWSKDYLQTLQHRTKWEQSKPNIEVNDVVIMKDNDLHRNDWPIGIVEQTFPGSDGLTRKVQLRVVRDGQPKTYIRPITQLVPLNV